MADSKSVKKLLEEMERVEATRHMSTPDQVIVSLDVWRFWCEQLNAALREPTKPRKVWVRYEVGTLESVCVRNFEPGEKELNADSTKSWHEFQVDGGAPLNEQEELPPVHTHDSDDYRCDACGEYYCHPGHHNCKGDPKARMIREYFRTRGKNDPPPATNPGTTEEHSNAEDVRFMMALIVRAVSKVDSAQVHEFLRGHCSVDALVASFAVKYLGPMAVALRQVLEHCKPQVERTGAAIAEYHRETNRSVDKEDIRAIISLNLHGLVAEMDEKEE